MKVFDSDIINPPLITATINHCVVIMKKKPQLVKMLLTKINKYDTMEKLRSNYQSVEQFKLARKYVDRNIRIFIQHCLKQKLVPTEFQNPLNIQANALTDRGADIRKRTSLLLMIQVSKRRNLKDSIIHQNVSRNLLTVICIH